MDAVVFDLGGVLIDWDPRYLYKTLFNGDEPAMERFLQTVCPADWNRQMDAGKPFAEAVAERQALFPEHAHLIARWHSDWEVMLKDAIPQTLQILSELRERNVRLYALTNWSAETFPLARARFPFLEWFEHIVVSGEVKLAKPDPRIFELTLTRCQLNPHATVYIDDLAHNVDAARALGMTALHFRQPGQLRADLQRLGLL
ncbi:MAG: HAD family phosphatase [Betaproteobacteria bacterium]